jgi:extracellular factor (EF) 3-hydroxypalmitic acid methyl ester biosynthesis protein
LAGVVLAGLFCNASETGGGRQAKWRAKNFVLPGKMFYPCGMSQTLNGGGNGHSGSKIAKPPAKPSTPTHNHSGVTFQTAEGVKLSGTLVRATRHAVFFELYSPLAQLRFSEVLGKFEVALHGRVVYSGRAVMQNLIDAGEKTVCEAELDEAQWIYADANSLSMREGKFAVEFEMFLREWEKGYKIAPEFKVVTTDMQMFLHELKTWLDQVELNTRAFAEPLRTQLQNQAVEQAAPTIIRAIDVFIARFESFVTTLNGDQHFSYQSHLRRHLHPLIMASPFARRTYTKPLGYAGDYGMVNMMLQPASEGETLFAKTVNVWLLGQAPAQAHRNRVVILERHLLEETLRVKRSGRVTKILNLGCGPAHEVQSFLKANHIHNNADFTLVDFNEETLAYVGQCLQDIGRHLREPARIRLVKKSVLQILKDSGRSLLRSPGEKYDYIYCAGLFDYLQKDVCKQLMTVFYNMLAPNGLLLTTNVTEKLNSSKPFRFSMEYLLDWHLIYRDRPQFLEVVPDAVPADSIAVSADETGVNLFLKIRKPDNAYGG